MVIIHEIEFFYGFAIFFPLFSDNISFYFQSRITLW